MMFNWNYFKEKLVNSPNDVQIFEKAESDKQLVGGNTVLETITGNVSFILVNKYLRILGTSNSLIIIIN
mgnify:FL=1